MSANIGDPMSNKNKMKNKPLSEASEQELENIAGDEGLMAEVVAEEQAQEVGYDPGHQDEAVVDTQAGEEFNLEKPILRDLATLQAVRKQLVVDLAAARKDDEGHELAKQLETQLEQVDAEILPLREEQLRKQEKIKLKEVIGKPVLPEVKSRLQSPVSTGLISDSQIPAMFKLDVKAPTSVAFDLIKIGDILSEAAYDIYFAYNGSSPVIQESIKALAQLNQEICEAITEEEKTRLAKEAQK
jgi:hypothetical protein